MESILPSDAPDAIDEAAQAGFDGIELDIDGPELADDPLWTAEGRERLCERANAAGVEIPSICLGFLNGGNVTSDDESVRDDAKQALERGADAAADLGAEVILVPFFWRAEIETDGDRSRLVDGMREVAPAAERAGVTFALENTLSAGENLELLDKIDSSAVKFYYDTGNHTYQGYDPAEEIPALGEQMSRIHFKDRTTDGDGRMLGDGTVDFEAVREALDEVGYDEWITLETASPTDRMADAEANLAFSRGLYE
jgi:sugar phosphate isomerase/epimerase